MTMRKTNPTGYIIGVLFLGLMVLVWLWTHQTPLIIRQGLTLVWLAAASLSGFFIWRRSLAVSRLVDDIPASRIDSAAQGYVELMGKAGRMPDDIAPDSPSTGAVLWRRTETAQRAGIENFRLFPFNMFYTPTDCQVTETPFSIRDGTGHAIILPQGADVLCEEKEVNYRGDTRYTEETILEGTPVYVFGNFETRNAKFDLVKHMQDIVARWKENPKLVERFDKNHNKLLDFDELIEMHKAARTVAEREEQRVLASPALNLVSQTDNGQRFVISTFHPSASSGTTVGTCFLA